MMRIDDIKIARNSILEWERNLEPLNSVSDCNSDDHPVNCLPTYDTYDYDSKIAAVEWSLYCLVLKNRCDFRLNCKIEDTWYFKTYTYDNDDEYDDILVSKKLEFGYQMYKKIKRLLSLLT